MTTMREHLDRWQRRVLARLRSRMLPTAREQRRRQQRDAQDDCLHPRACCSTFTASDGRPRVACEVCGHLWAA